MSDLLKKVTVKNYNYLAIKDKLKILLSLIKVSEEL